MQANRRRREHTAITGTPVGSSLSLSAIYTGADRRVNISSAELAHGDCATCNWDKTSYMAPVAGLRILHAYFALALAGGGDGDAEPSWRCVAVASDDVSFDISLQSRPIT